MPTRVCNESRSLQRADRCDQLQPRPYRALSVVLMGLRIAEVDQHAVAHVLRYEPAEALHCLGDALLIGGNDLAQVLWVHTRRERGRTDEVREHHRDLAALGGVLRLRFGRSSRLRWRWRVLDGGEYFQSMPKGDAEFFQALICQVGQDRGVDVVLGKALRVLPKTELLKPVRNLLHRGSALVRAGRWRATLVRKWRACRYQRRRTAPAHPPPRS